MPVQAVHRRPLGQQQLHQLGPALPGSQVQRGHACQGGWEVGVGCEQVGWVSDWVGEWERECGWGGEWSGGRVEMEGG